jgi:formylglycine-generating enzyme
LELDERPIHNIYTADYWIDKFPVTNRQYADFLNTAKPEYIDSLIDITNRDCKIVRSDSVYTVADGFDNFPVVDVSWYGANEYAQFHGKTLPTEAEWERATRGSDARLYPWGDSIKFEYANYWDSGDPFDNNPTPVGFFNGNSNNGFQTADAASPFGVYDLVDNVRQWCSDWYEWNYYSKSPMKNPTGPMKGAEKVVRGGGYLFHEDKLRATFRSSFAPEITNGYTGFRCVIRRL